MSKSKSELKTAYENMMRKKKIEGHLVNLEKRIKHQKKEVKHLQRVVDKEEDDVIELQKLSLHSIFTKLLGTKEHELEKQRQEYLMAALKWQGAKKSLEALKFEKVVLEKQLSGLFNAEIKFDNVFNKFENTLTQSLEDKTKLKLKKLDLRILNHEERIKEIREAIQAGKKAEKILVKIIKDLSEIKSWGNPFLNQKKSRTIYGKGKHASYGKRNFVSLAKKDAQKANILLEHFEIEILDIYKQFKLDYRNYIKSFSDFLEIFYDNLITDWVVKKSIDNTIHAMETIHDKVIRIHTMLQNEIVKTKEYILEEKSLRKDIIVKDQTN